MPEVTQENQPTPPNPDETKRKALYDAAIAASDTYIESHKRVFTALAELVEKPDEREARDKAAAAAEAARKLQLR